jgi:adenylate cyclase
VVSRWVRGEARDAAERGILVPVRFDQARLPIDVRAIHTTDLDNWHEDPAHPAVQECLHALGAMITRSHAADGAGPLAAAAAPDKPKPKFSVCVLPFTNMSGDSEQEYFSDGMTEDITTDLSKVSALAVTASNMAFRYKGQHADILEVARALKVTHVLEGSVRKAGERVRINAQLIDGASGKHVWAERYDRDANDIFAIQDEISQAIVKALKLRLLPAEKKAIERRGTDNVEAHDLYLMARQTYITAQEADARSAEAIVRLCKRVTELDPNYAQAWALMAVGYYKLQILESHTGQDGMAAVERALALEPELAEAHAIKALLLLQLGDADGAAAEVAIALKLDPESYEANRAAGRLSYQLRQSRDAIRFLEKAAALVEADINSINLLMSCYAAVGDAAGMRRSAELALKRCEAVLAHDQNNSGVIGYSVYALAVLGDGERAKARMNRALLVDPDNFNMRYNFACALCQQLQDKEAALAMLKSVFASISEEFLPYAKADSDLDSLHDDPRYQAMVEAAEARLAAARTVIEPANQTA